MTLTKTAAVCFLAASSCAAAPIAGLKDALQIAADQTSAQFKCAINIAFKDADNMVGVASGSSGADNRTALVDDPFVWGSVTKCLTGSSMLKLVEEGVVSLDDPIGMHIDPFLKKLAQNPADAKFMNYSSVEELWGPDVSTQSIRMLGKMMAGIPDFDTATERSGGAVDPFRATLYAEPSHAFGPPEILSLPWVYTKQVNLHPSSHAYSSTNFMLFGLILAAKAGVASWSDFDQLSPLPPAFARSLRGIMFASKPACPRDLTNITGYDRTAYNGHDPSAFPGTDVSRVDGVFSGWSASDLVGPDGAVAELVHGIYGSYRVASAASVENIMVPKANESFYGFGTFNLSRRTGVGLPVGAAYGHLGATYGFQSIVAHFPHYNFTLTVASNIETDDQSQPAAGLCRAFNMARALVEGRPVPNCTYVDGGYYSGGCKCSDMPTPPPSPAPAPEQYSCLFKRCIPNKHGTQSKDDCDSSCK